MMSWVESVMTSLKPQIGSIFPKGTALFSLASALTSKVFGRGKRLGFRPSLSDSLPDQVKIPLSRLLRRSFLKTALIPLVAVEVILVLAFLVTHQVSTASQVAVQRVAAEENLARLVQAQAEVLNQELNSVTFATKTFQRQALHALTKSVQPDAEEQSRYSKTSGGGFATLRDNGGAAAFYSNRTTVGAVELQKVWKTVQLDSVMKDLVETQPLLTQIYFNSFDSYNRIYPYRDVVRQYAPDLDIPSYNFYYLADALHNPSRGTVWTDAYLDPAGQGWMVSCIAPVYNQNFLEGVVGSDITVEVLINQVLSTRVPWHGYALLLAKDGTILALPPSAEQEWGLRERTIHHYTDFVQEDTFKPEEFNLFRRPEMQTFSEAIQQQFTAVQTLELSGVKKLAAWSHIPDTGWTYVVIVPEEEVFARTQQLGQRLLLLGKAMIVGMIVFYVLFVIYLIRSGEQMSRRVAEPLVEIEQLVNAIATGQYNQPLPAMPIAELDHAATQVVEMGNTLGERTEALMKALKVKSDFLGIISHELRTPMNGILGMGELLRQTDLNLAQQDYVDTMMVSSENLLRLLNDILDMSKLEARSLTLTPTQFDLSSFLQEKAMLWQRRIEQKGLQFEWQLSPDLPRQVIGDRERLRQMLNNYLNNALKFTATGHICLQVIRATSPLDAVPQSPYGNTKNGDSIATDPSAVDSSAVDSSAVDSPMVDSFKTLSQIDCPEGSCAIRFAVSDTGIGIPATSLSQLFRPFSQVDNSLQRSYDGAGLGLSIVKELAGLMDGTVGADSIEGQGSTFWFEVCLQSIDGCQSQSPTSLTSPVSSSPLQEASLANLKILLAEDNQVNQKFALLCLKQMGITCDIASNGREAIDRFTQQPYDLVLMDIHMPEVDGICALQAIRKIDPTALVVAVTADALPEARDRLLEAGFNDFLEKPFRVKEMKALLLKLDCSRLNGSSLNGSPWV